LKMQEYRYGLLMALGKFWELFGVRRPAQLEAPVPAGDYDHALHVDHPEAPSLLEQYLDNHPKTPKLGGAPRETVPSVPEIK